MNTYKQLFNSLSFFKNSSIKHDKVNLSVTFSSICIKHLNSVPRALCLNLHSVLCVFTSACPNIFLSFAPKRAQLNQFRVSNQLKWEKAKRWHQKSFVTAESLDWKRGRLTIQSPFACSVQSAGSDAAVIKDFFFARLPWLIFSTFFFPATSIVQGVHLYFTRLYEAVFF